MFEDIDKCWLRNVLAAESLTMTLLREEIYVH